MKLGLQATGMEFASEIVVKATINKQRIAEVPTTLAKDGRSRPPHLHTWRDGWRHLRFLMLFSPRWLFLYPGLALLLLGIVIGAVVVPRPLSVGSVTFDVDTLVVASAMVVIGFQAVLFALFTQVYASAEGFLPEQQRVRRILKTLSLERGLVVGGILFVVGIVGLAFSLSYWGGASFHSLDYNHALRLVVPSVTALIVSFQIILGTFFLSILSIRHTRHPAIGALETAEEERDAAPGKVARSRTDSTGTVGVDTGAPVTGGPAQATANGHGDQPASGQATEDEAVVPATAGRDSHGAGAEGA
jgi:hypothetical protein